jgi:hypothetical protein
MYSDEVRVEVPVGEPYFEQPRVEVNKETYAEDAFRTEFNKNAHQRNDGAYRPPRGIENEVRRGRYNFHDNDRNGNYRNERNDRNDKNKFQEPQRNEFEEPNQNVRQEIGNNAIGLDNIMNMIEQTYDPNLQRAARPTFRRPYLDRIEREFERPRNYKVPDFCIFFGDDEKTAYEHISRFTIQCKELSNNGNGKLIMFPNSLTRQAFMWYSSLPPHSIETWNDMEENILNHFARVDLGISMADLSRLKQELGEIVDQFIMKFKRTRLRCQTQLPESEPIRFAVNGLNFELRKKFEGVNFYDLFDLVDKDTRYEGLLREENQRRNTSIRAYYQDPNFEVDVAKFIGLKPYVLETTYKKNMQAKGSNRSLTPAKTYHFDVNRADELFDILLESKYINLPDPRHKIFSKEELRGREHCKWHSSFTHSTNNCLTFRNIIQEKFNNKILKFHDKPKENMAVDTEPFPKMVDINMVTMCLNPLLENENCSEETFINMYQALSLQGKEN